MITADVVTDTTGLTAIHDTLKQRTITLKAVKAGAKIVLNATKAAMTKRDTGLLKKSQGTKAMKGRDGATQSLAVIGARKKTEKMVVRKGRRKPTKAVPAFYDHIVRLGARPHSVSKGQRLDRAKRMGKRGKMIGGQSRTSQEGTQHPGVKGSDFRMNGWNSSKDQAGAATLDVMGAEVNAAMAEQSRSVLAKLSGVK